MLARMVNFQSQVGLCALMGSTHKHSPRPRQRLSEKLIWTHGKTNCAQVASAAPVGNIWSSHSTFATCVRAASSAKQDGTTAVRQHQNPGCGANHHSQRSRRTRPCSTKIQDSEQKFYSLTELSFCPGLNICMDRARLHSHGLAGCTDWTSIYIARARVQD